MINVDRTQSHDMRELERLNLKRRHRLEKRFKLYGLTAITIAITILCILIFTVVKNSLPAFWETRIKLTIDFDPKIVNPQGINLLDLSASPKSKDDKENYAREQARNNAIAQFKKVNYKKLYTQALGLLFPEESKSRSRRKVLYSILSPANQYMLMNMVIDNPRIIGKTQDVWLMVHTDVDSYNKGLIDGSVSADQRKISDDRIRFVEELREQGLVRKQFSTQFFTNGASMLPETAGIMGALLGSFWTLLITLIVSLPIGVFCAVYLEEFAPKNKFTYFIEVNVNNLAAIPSIVFGLLGLIIFINILDMSRSTPLVGGLTLAMMSLPTIIIATRAALKGVPASIRNAAFALGATPMQAMFHHTLPLALPGILTGSIVSMAQALGETAPLLMIGMVAFVQGLPGSPLEPASTLPVQVFLWSDSPERAFAYKTSAAIMILLLFLILMNFLAVYLRRKYECKW